MVANKSGMRTVLVNGVVIGEVPMTGDRVAETEAAARLMREKGFHRQLNRAQTTFRHAYAFAIVAAKIYAGDLQKPPRFGLVAAPFVVNSVFAIELYFKALAEAHGQRLTGHELAKLYRQLPGPARALLDAHWPNALAAVPLAGNAPLEECVARLNDVFRDWRYLYEKESHDEVRIPEVIAVSHALHHACEASGKV